MTTQKKKKSAKQKRVLIGSVVVAAAIVAGSTFAWFSSKDEVTNRLTASANYNVSIVEDFQPPKEWIPGQTINKDVAAVNTGNVDAFVRMWLGGTMRLLNEETPNVDVNSNGLATTLKSLQKVSDESRTKLGLNYYKEDGDTITYYKTLSTKQIDNPNDENHPTAPNEETNNPATFSEVQSMQAAGVLVLAPVDAKYTWTMEQAAEMWVRESDTKAVLQNVAKGTEVGSVKSDAQTKIAANATDGAHNYYGPIDASTFKPHTSGLYLFRRNIGETDDGTANTFEYSGYFYVDDLDGGTYFALHTGDGDNQHSDYVVPAGSVKENNSATPSLNQVLPVTVENNKVFLFTAKEELVNDLTWKYENATNNDPARFVVTKNNTTDPNKKIEITVALANIGAEAEQWTAIEDGNTSSPSTNKTTFYYTNDLEAGDTTRKLVDSVTLSDATQVGAYLAFDFDLNVFMDSVQVTMDESGKEGVTTVNPSWGTANITDDTAVNHGNVMTGAKGSIQTQTGSEIDLMKWENLP